MQHEDINTLPFPVLVIAKDKVETCLAVNTLFEHMIGLDIPLLTPLSQVWHGKRVNDLIKSKVVFNESEEACFRVEHHSGKYNDKNATYLYFIDVTDLVQSSKKLQEELRQADAMAEMKSNFLATMSHEIRTPMQSIYGLLELISEEDVSQSIQDMLKTAKGSATSLLEILDDVLDHAKIDADKMELDDFEVPLRMLAYGTVEALSVKAPGGHVKLLTDIDENVPFVVKGDPKRLRQILTNLIGNALKFTHEGTVTLKVSTDVKTIISPDNGVGLRFEIVDTGIGMSQDVCDTLFEAFKQADTSTTRKYGGTGLGLSICKKLVALMNGEIGAFSEQGKGSTFWFEIPTLAIDTDESSVELPDLTGLAVLSLEDHPQGAKEIVNSLRSMGASVENAPTLDEALNLVTRRRYDVVISDYNLPDGLGTQLLKHVSEHMPSAGLILYTIMDDYGLSQSCKALGATYLVKPASRIGLGEAVFESAVSQKKNTHSGPRKILIAEDTESVRYVLEKQVKQLDVDTDFVEDGEKAYKKLQTGEYGLIITDLHMPKLDGYGLVKKIRDDEKEQNDPKQHPFPVVLLTADVQMAQRQAYLTHGFDECLLKPVSIGQLRRLLSRWDIMDDEVSSPQKTSPKNMSEIPKTSNSIDLKAMEEQMGEVNKDNLEMISMFIEMTHPQINSLRDISESNDLNALAEAAHSLKGGARSACCTVLGDLASELQDSAEEGRNKIELIDEIEAEFTQVQNMLKDLLEKAA